MMVHALIYRKERWWSFGLHASSNWPLIFITLKRAYGDNNVTAIKWGEETAKLNPGQMQLKVESEVSIANNEPDFIHLTSGTTVLAPA